MLVSLANHDAYYTLFNNFLRAHPEVLDAHSLLEGSWRGIVDYDNKCRWFRTKLNQIRCARLLSSYKYSLPSTCQARRERGEGLRGQGVGFGRLLPRKVFIAEDVSGTQGDGGGAAWDVLQSVGAFILRFFPTCSKSHYNDQFTPSGPKAHIGASCRPL